MLRIPQVIAETVPSGPLAADARAVLGLLRDPVRAGLWIVTLAEEMPVRESEELLAATRDDLGISVDQLVVNALFPDDYERAPALAEAEERVASSAPPALAPLLRSARTLRSRREINRRYLEQLARLGLPQIELPYLFAAELDRACIDQLAARIGEALPAPAAASADRA